VFDQRELQGGGLLTLKQMQRSQQHKKYRKQQHKQAEVSVYLLPSLLSGSLPVGCVRLCCSTHSMDSMQSSSSTAAHLTIHPLCVQANGKEATQLIRMQEQQQAQRQQQGHMSKPQGLALLVQAACR
jgi:hypothetical protein